MNTACYSFGPPPAGGPPAGADARVQLSSEGTTELARDLGPRVGAVDGKIASVGSDGSLVLAVTWVQLVDGVRQPWTGEGRVTIPKQYVASVEQRTLNRRKSYIAGAAIAGAVLLVAFQLIKGGGGNGLPETPTDGGIGLRRPVPHG